MSSFNAWNTKEVVLYGRWFGYTPYFYSNVDSAATDSESVSECDQQNFKDIVKTELIWEHLQNDDISFNTCLVNWIEDVEKNIWTKTKKEDDDTIIDVVDDGDSTRIDTKHIKTEYASSTEHKVHLPIEPKYQEELSLINDIYRSTQTKFEPEEIIEGRKNAFIKIDKFSHLCLFFLYLGVLHRSAEQVLIVAMRSFVEDMIRKSFGFKPRSQEWYLHLKKKLVIVLLKYLKFLV